MKLQTGDLLITQSGSSIVIVEVEKSGLVKGFHGNKTKIEQIGYESYIIQHLTYGRWRHFPVVK